MYVLHFDFTGWPRLVYLDNMLSHSGVWPIFLLQLNALVSVHLRQQAQLLVSYFLLSYLFPSTAYGIFLSTPV